MTHASPAHGLRARDHLARGALHVALSPPALLALVVTLASLLSATAMAALGVPMSVAWLAPSVEWMVRHQPLVVLEWMGWLMIPATVSVALAALVFRGVVGVRWWGWALAGLVGFAAVAALRAYSSLAPFGAVLPSALPEPYRLPLTIGGAVAGLIVTPLAAGLARMLASLHRSRNGLAQGTRPAPARGTVSVRAS